MPTSAVYLDFIKEQFCDFGPVTVRRMFGDSPEKLIEDIKVCKVQEAAWRKDNSSNVAKRARSNYLLMRAQTLMDEGDYRGAIALLNEVVRLEPENYEGWLDLGISYAQKGFYQEAERCYVKARELNPDDVLLNYNVAALYSLWDRRADALSALRKALEKEPAKVRSWLAADPMFDGLKGAPEFEQLVSAK